MGSVEGGKGCRMAKSSFGFHQIIPIVVLLLIISLSPVTAKPGAKPLAKSDPGHLVHDFYKCTSPVYRLSPECQQPAPQFVTGRIFSESEHFVEGGGGSQNPHQVAQINWPSYGSNTGNNKNPRSDRRIINEKNPRRYADDFFNCGCHQLLCCRAGEHHRGVGRCQPTRPGGPEERK